MGLTKTQSGGLEDQSVTLDKLPHGDGSSDGKFLRANNGADPSFETVSTDLVADTSPQLGGNLDAGSHSIIFDDNSKLKLGNNNDLQIYHDGTNSHLLNTTNALIIRSDALRLNDGGNTETMIKADANGAVELYHDNSKKFETHANGAQVQNAGADTTFFVKGAEGRSSEIQFLADEGDDYADYSRIHKDQSTGKLHFQNYAGGGWENNLVLVNDGAVELYHVDVKQVETTENGILLPKGCIRGLGGNKVIIGGTIDPSQDRTWNFSFNGNANGTNNGVVFNVKFYMNHWNTGGYYKYIENIIVTRGNTTAFERINLINNVGTGSTGWTNGHIDNQIVLSGGTIDGSSSHLFKVKYDADGAPSYTSGYYLEVNYSNQIGTITIT